jgi:hypothetical protein
LDSSNNDNTNAGTWTITAKKDSAFIGEGGVRITHTLGNLGLVSLTRTTRITTAIARREAGTSSQVYDGPVGGVVVRGIDIGGVEASVAGVVGGIVAVGSVTGAVTVTVMVVEGGDAVVEGIAEVTVVVWEGVPDRV